MLSPSCISPGRPLSHSAHLSVAIAHRVCLAEPRAYEESQRQDELEKDGMSVEQPVNNVSSSSFDHHNWSIFPVTLYPPTLRSNQCTHLSVKYILIYTLYFLYVVL